MSVILATAGYDHKIRFWEAPSGICSRTLRYPDSQVNCLEITPDKQFLAAGGNPHIRLFEINSGNANGANANPVLTCEGHTSSVTSLGFLRHGTWMYSSSEDGTVKLWDLRSSTYSRSFDSGAPVNDVALHPDQTQLLSGDQSGSVKVWDLGGSGKSCVNELVPDSGQAVITEEIVNTDDPNNNNTVTPNTIKPSPSASTTHSPSAAIQAVDVAEDRRTVVAATNHADVFVWDASSPEGVRDLQPVNRFRAHPHGTYLLRAKLSPDCRHLVTTGSDGTARLWDTKTWELTRTLGRHQRWVWDAVFSADSSYLVTASSDHWARLWNLGTGEVVRQYTGHQGAVTCVALNDSST